MIDPTRSTFSEERIGKEVTNAVSRWTARLAAAWAYPILKSLWMRLVLLLLIVALCGLRAYIGVAGTSAYSHDLFMVLDGAWRMMNGQRPHTDFYSHLGVLTYAPTILGLWIARGSASGFAYAQALVALVLGIWTYLLSRQYLSDVGCAFMSLSVVLLAASPSALGDGPGAVAAGMIYNRQGYALLAIILVEAFGETRGARRDGKDLVGGLSTGAALALLLFLKVTYFIFGLFLLIALSLVIPQRKRHWVSLALAFAAVSTCFFIYLHFQLRPMVDNLITVAGAKRLRLWSFGLDIIFQQLGTAVVFVLMAALLLLVSQQPRQARIVALAGLATCATGFLIFGNYEHTGFPMAVFLAVIVIDFVIHFVPVGKSYSIDAFHACVLLLGSVLIVASLSSGALALIHGVGVRLLRVPQYQGLDSPTLKSFIPIDSDELYGEFVNDGLDLVRKYRHGDETVMSLDFTNPFSFGLGIKPAPGGTTVLQYGTTFDKNHKPSAQFLFGFADLVMLPKPKYFTDASLTDYLVVIYGPYLETHFERVGESKFWYLYRHRLAG